MPSEYENRFTDFEKRLTDLMGYLNISEKKEEINAFEKELSAPGFWDNNERAQEVIAAANSRKVWVEAVDKLYKHLEDLKVLLELVAGEEEAQGQAELEQDFGLFEKELADLEFRKMLSGENDANNALLTIHPGAGGTESQDWAQMLWRMYQYWIDKHGFKRQVLDFQPGEEAGLKNITLEVNGQYAYGYLRAETGIHRLVRISPFDANKRRHTSFASVYVLPEVEDNIKVEINDNDLRVDTYRASGAGGQHVNKVSSAVRITHIPTGIVVQCQTDRSQHKNRESAMKVLRARLYEHYKKLEDEKRAETESEKKDIAWGNQIRSYVFCPYTMVKDHRTNVETGNIEAVMEGDLDQFIKAYLTQY